MTPAWFGRRYPKLEDLITAAQDAGALVGWAGIGEEAIFAPPNQERDEPPVILLPEHAGPLRVCWLLAHELGHLYRHAGPKTCWTRRRDEHQADRWAARALIPEARIRRHENASLDAFIGALSAHYQDLPLTDCPERRLAARIASIRLSTLEESCA